MDQIRKVLGWFKRYHFWVLSVMIALISVFCWWSASGAMSKLYKDAESKISGGFQQVKTVQNDSFHPNEVVKEQQTNEIKKLVDDVTKLWQQLYDAQSQGVLIWPEQLRADFRAAVEKLEFGSDIPGKFPEQYQNYIDRHFPKLPEKIGARAIEEGTAAAGASMGFSRSSPEGLGGAMSTGGQMEDDSGYICLWAPENQTLVRQELEFPQTPSSLRIWCTQENLWVYHTLLDVIKNTNDAAHATRISNAAVRAVYSLQVGQTAAPFSRQPNRIYKLATAAAAGAIEGGEPGAAPEPGAGPMGDPMMGGGRGMGMPGGEFGAGMSGLAMGGEGQMTEEQERGLLLNGRYLDEEGKPIPYGAGASVDGAPAEPPVDAGPAAPLDISMFGKEYRRLPVRMVLEVDQRHLPRLIAECADRPLQIEVQEVRVNAPDLLGGGGGAMGAMNFSGGAGGMGGGSLIPDLAGLQRFMPHPEIATVAIQGVIYIFRRPDQELLKPPGEPGEDPGAVAANQ